MSRFAKAVLILMLAAIPLRGMAGVISAFCEPQHHGAGQMTHAECDGCEHDATRHEEPGDDSNAKCGHCSACSVSAPLVSESARGISYAGSDTLPILFLDRGLPARFPERLERPPLAL
ncbi:MAG: hypothetical protein AABM33_00565 [Pseudomonadota bacterium]